MYKIALLALLWAFPCVSCASLEGGGIMLMARRNMMVGGAKLPYKRVLWIDGNGTNLIDLGFTEDVTDVIKITFSHVRYGYQSILIGRGNVADGNPVFSIAIYSPDETGFRSFGLSGRGGTLSGTKVYANTDDIHEYVIDLPNRTQTIDDKCRLANFVVAKDNTGRNSCLCGYQRDGQFPYKMRVYGYERYRGGKRINNFICVVKDGVAGVYDTENDVFIANTGTGTMSVGPEI